MPLCNSCQNLTFDPLDQASDRFQAVAQKFSSLKRQAELRECNFCVALLSTITTQQKTITRDDASVSLAIQYQPEKDDDWDFEFIGEEIGLSDGDAPEYLLIDHPDVQDLHFRIHNPMVLSRSSLHFEEDDDGSLRDGNHTAQPLDPTFPGIPYDASTGNDSNMSLMRSWITRCEISHQSCRKKPSEPSSIYPTRLLDVSTVEDNTGLVFLVISASRNFDTRRPSYATLSHRWEKNHSCLTKASTEHEYTQNGIPKRSLTKTFREACITVKKLGLDYIWIDSLCIIQDSDDDKIREIPKMADYYQNADFNIAAATNCDGEASLWQERDGGATRPFNLPIRINMPTFPRKTRKVTLTVSPVLRATKSHLDSRGWILQERIFPRRTLFFDPYWVSFECAEMSASESCPQGICKNTSTNAIRLENNMATVLSRDPSLSTMGGLLRARYSEAAAGGLLGMSSKG